MSQSHLAVHAGPMLGQHEQLGEILRRVSQAGFVRMSNLLSGPL